jgi:hypothetical protein
MVRTPKILSDFDSTLIKQNSLNIFTFKIIKYYLKKGNIAKILKSIPALWIRVKEIYITKKLVPEILIFDDSDIVIRKAKKLKNVPYSIYKRDTIPELEINPTWIVECMKMRMKHKIESKTITIVSRNGIDEINDFLDASANDNTKAILSNQELMENVRQITHKKYYAYNLLIKKEMTNRDVLKFFDVDIEIIANDLCKKPAIVNNQKDMIYTGIVKGMHEIGVIERRNKALLYENNLVLADKEEILYQTWAKDFTCVEK